jgi:hypothetical protein
MDGHPMAGNTVNIDIITNFDAFGIWNLNASVQ